MHSPGGRIYPGLQWTINRRARDKIISFETAIQDGSKERARTEEYTGRELIRTVVNLNHVYLSDFHSCLEIDFYGHWIIKIK